MTLTTDTLRPMAEALPAVSSVIGGVFLLLGLPGLLAPARFRSAARAYPRSVWPGRVLSAVALVWSALWLQVMPLGPVAVIRPYLPVLTIGAVAAVWFWCDELLSCRAVGALLVLVPTPMLSAAQWHTSPARFFVLVLAYLLAVAGMFVVAQPYHLRDVLSWSAATPSRLRAVSVVPTAIGAALLVLGLFVF